MNFLSHLYDLRYPMNKEAENRIHMSLIQEISAEQLVRLFHHYQSALTHDFSGYTKEDPSASWETAPENERKVMIAAARLTLLELVSPHEEKTNRSYFAKPGEAEWGC
jgi:hypothetical protein